MHHSQQIIQSNIDSHTVCVNTGLFIHIECKILREHTSPESIIMCLETLLPSSNAHLN